MTAGSQKVFRNGHIYQSAPGTTHHEEPRFSSCMVIKDDVIQHIGDDNDCDAVVKEAKEAGAEIIDLKGKKVLPSFIDGHMHLLMLGQSLTKAPLDGCQSLEDIRSRIKKAAQEDPHSPRIYGRGWMHSMTPQGVDASLLDDLDPRPIIIDAKDLHSTWCNSAALKEVCERMDIDPNGSTPDPPGGTIQRGSDGKPNGVFHEAAVFELLWPFAAQVASMEERKTAIRAAITAYNSAGYTGMIDMAMDDTILEPLVELHREGLGGVRIAAYWLMKPLKEGQSLDTVLAQVDRAAELAKQYSTPELRVVGIKIICDGIIDACTATLTEPYTSGADPGPIWSEEALHPVIARAHAAGLQVALHAIGDQTIRMAIDVLEKNTDRSLRPRIEHLELASAEDAARLGRLGITASIQPVHSDPAIIRAWKGLLGEQRCKRMFPYQDFAKGGASLALGSDSPTAPHLPIPNLYVATSRRSWREPKSNEIVNPEFALTVCQAIAAATEGSAYSCFAEGLTGRLEPGLKADFVVCEVELTPEKLIDGKVKETWFEGRQVYKESG